MEKNFKAAEFLFKKIKSIYPTFEMPGEFDVEIWLEVLEGFSQTEILDALKEYRITVEYNTPPIPGTFKKFLKHTDTPQTISQASEELKVIAPAEQLMQRDVELKRCRHLLPVYQRAVKYIVGERLFAAYPEFQRRGVDLASRYTAAKNNGLFDDFDQVLIGICRRDYGKDYQFESEAQLEAAKANRAFNIQNTPKNLGNTWKNVWWNN